MQAEICRKPDKLKKRRFPEQTGREANLPFSPSSSALQITPRHDFKAQKKPLD